MMSKAEGLLLYECFAHAAIERLNGIGDPESNSFQIRRNLDPHTFSCAQDQHSVSLARIFYYPLRSG
jgi:hypothetical protein